MFTANGGRAQKEKGWAALVLRHVLGVPIFWHGEAYELPGRTTQDTNKVRGKPSQGMGQHGCRTHLHLVRQLRCGFEDPTNIPIRAEGLAVDMSKSNISLINHDAIYFDDRRQQSIRKNEIHDAGGAPCARHTHFLAVRDARNARSHSTKNKLHPCESAGAMAMAMV